MRDCYSLAGLFLGELFPRGFFQSEYKAHTKSFDPVYSSDMADSTSCHHFADQTDDEIIVSVNNGPLNPNNVISLGSTSSHILSGNKV